jgi:hypothetical protein
VAEIHIDIALLVPRPRGDVAHKRRCDDVVDTAAIEVRRANVPAKRVEKFKSCVYRDARLEERDDGPALVVRVDPRKNGQPFCSGCGRRDPAYDRLGDRQFEFVPLWGIVGTRT